MLPPICMDPPNTYVNSTTNMIGWMSPKMTISGMRDIRIRLRFAMTSESRTDCPSGWAGLGAAPRTASVTALI